MKFSAMQPGEVLHFVHYALLGRSGLRRSRRASYQIAQISQALPFARHSTGAVICLPCIWESLLVLARVLVLLFYLIGLMICILFLSNQALDRLLYHPLNLS